MNGRMLMTSALGAMLLLAAGVGGASARSSDEAGLSADGVTWDDVLLQPLFDPEVRWVPGDTQTATFHVRNQGPSAATLTVTAQSAAGAGLLGPDEIELAARATGSGWHALGNGDASGWLVDRAIQQGGQARVEVRVRFLWEASNDAMRERLPLTFEVRLVQATATDTTPRQDGSHGWLPDTGSGLSRFVVWLGAILIGSGLALLVARRRLTDESSVPDEAVHDGSVHHDEAVTVDG